jgi:hypothetical protein
VTARVEIAQAKTLNTNGASTVVGIIFFGWLNFMGIWRENPLTKSLGLCARLFVLKEIPVARLLSSYK